MGVFPNSLVELLAGKSPKRDHARLRACHQCCYRNSPGHAKGRAHRTIGDSASGTRMRSYCMEQPTAAVAPRF